MAKKTEITKAPTQSTALATIEQELAKFAADVSAVEPLPAGSFISVRGGQLSYGGNPITGNKLEAVVLDSIHENCFYEGDFDPDNPQPPVCYAFGVQEEGMKPHPDSAKPQSETCASCPNNQWGSADRGKGKACKNMRRLAVLPVQGLTSENVGEMEEAYIKVSVTSVRNWSGYVKGVAATFNRPPFAMVTKISVVPDTKSQHKWTFEPLEPLPGELLPGMMTRYRAHTEGKKSEFPYPKASEAEPAPAKKPAAKGKGKF